MSTGLVNTAVRLYRESGGTVPRGHRTLLRSVHGDFTSSRGFRWPFPGSVAVADSPVKAHKGACPSVPGDGLCLGKTWAGIASGGVPASTLLLCAYRQQDVLGEDEIKLRVSRARVLEVFLFSGLLAAATAAERASLSGANLSGAYLFGAYLGALGPHLDEGWLADPRFLAGLALYGASLAGNVWSDAILRGLRTREEVERGEKVYRIPEGGLFEWVTCPSYLTELTGWAGLALATWSPAGLFILALSAANLVPRARATHRWYKARFPDYPAKRRALVPGVW